MGNPRWLLCSAIWGAPLSMQTLLQEKVRYKKCDHETFLFQFSPLPYAPVVVEPGRAAWKMIVKNFGHDILLEDGHIDRQKLGQIVFQDEAKRKILNSCTHPYIQRAMLWQVVKHFLRG